MVVTHVSEQTGGATAEGQPFAPPGQFSEDQAAQLFDWTGRQTGGIIDRNETCPRPAPFYFPLAADAMIPQTTLSYFDIETQINQWKDERGPR